MDYRAEALAFAWALQWFDPPEDKPPLADHEAFRWMLIERTLLHTPDDQGIVTHADGSTEEDWARLPLFPPDEDDPTGYDYNDEKGRSLSSRQTLATVRRTPPCAASPYNICSTGRRCPPTCARTLWAS
jgi:hypothetical protein